METPVAVALSYQNLKNLGYCQIFSHTTNLQPSGHCNEGALLGFSAYILLIEFLVFLDKYEF